ncbi:hypothetical protein [Breoghania sp. L-A4]|uniref:hypothetical protein n=1 Tax=Breoghania sp. L-A4 TaxID=2304600 RepID=UPI000E358420|nr:hypothetical protein [Breoghania sp. L-A4]AXS40393.1 hypothetical protein D1F64_10405 [Breoghania sp. L-A4]
MNISLAGLIGAGIGLYIGWVDYRMAVGALRGWTARKNQGEGTPFAAWLHRNSAPVERVMLVLLMLGIPAMGYIAGVTFAGG